MYVQRYLVRRFRNHCCQGNIHFIVVGADVAVKIFRTVIRNNRYYVF